jgi:hypothetical protein
MAEPSPIPCLTGCLLALLLAWLLGAAMRSLRIRHAWILSGVIAGVALGPTGLGRIAPATQASLFHGATRQRDEAALAERTLEVARAASRSRAASLDPADETRLEAEVMASHERLRDARETFDFPAMWLVSLLATFVMVGVSPLLGRVALWRGGGPAIGVWSASLPAAGLLAALSLHGSASPETWWIIAAAIACVGGAPPRIRDRWITAQLAGPLAGGVEVACAVAGMAALALVLAGAAAGICDEPAWLMPWAGLLAAWGLAWAPAPALRRLARGALAGAVAIACTRLELAADWRGWIALWTLVAIEDLRWLGATFGLMLWGGLGWTKSLRVCLPLADSSPAVAALASTALLANAMPVWMAAAMIVAAAAVSLMEPLRRSTAAHLERTLSGA